MQTLVKVEPKPLELYPHTGVKFNEQLVALNY